jgi:phage repressor protein C with HTH and peptisase S24 domain
MDSMDTSELRRNRLREWFATRPIPAREKSYLSQLMNEKASFGEKAARRLEETYCMGTGYLDSEIDSSLWEARQLRLANARNLVEEVGSISKFANMAEISLSSASKIVRGNSPGIGNNSARKIEAAFGKPTGWLDQTHEQPDDPYSENVFEIGPLRNVSATTDTVVIKKFDTGGSMGTGVLLRDQPGIIQSWGVTKEWLSRNVRSHTGADNLCIVTGFGDSMRPMFSPGDPLIVDTGVKTVEFDAIYFFRVGDEGFIKRLQRIPGQGIRAISVNKEYETWTITRDMDFEVFGRVLKVWSSEDF